MLEAQSPPVEDVEAPEPKMLACLDENPEETEGDEQPKTGPGNEPVGPRGGKLNKVGGEQV